MPYSIHVTLNSARLAASDWRELVGLIGGHQLWGDDIPRHFVPTPLVRRWDCLDWAHTCLRAALSLCDPANTEPLMIRKRRIERLKRIAAYLQGVAYHG